MGAGKKISNQIISHLVLLFSALLLVGCQAGFKTSTPTWPMAEISRDGDDGARISLFLNLKEADGPDVQLEIAAIEILTAGVWLPIDSGPQNLDSAQIGAAQVFVGGRSLRPGDYHRLRFDVTGSAVRKGDGRYESFAALSTRVEIAFPSVLSLSQNDSRSLFITWDVRETLNQPEIMHPVMTLAFELRQLLVDLVYVACPEIDTVFVIRSDKNWVADSFGIKGQPTYLAMDPDPSRRRLYVLASGESAIKTVDLLSQRVVDFIHIPLTEIPTFMTISPDGRWAYVLEERNSYLNQIDLGSGRSAGRERLGYRPTYATFLHDANLLAVSAELTQTVTLHSPTDLREVRAIRTGNSPEGLLMVGRELYIAERGDHSVAIYDFSANQLQRRLDVGFGPRRFLFNGDQIYVSNYENGTVSVLFPGQLGVVREIHGLGRPLEMAFNRAYRRLYVGDEKAGALAVVDSNVNQLIGWVHLGARPLGLAGLE